jgi:DNA primase
MAYDDAIERVLDAVDIVEVIGEAVQLKPRGANFVGLCPFHNEKTPSFTVSPTKKIYTCFGCGKKGNVFTFMKDYYGMEFGEALRELAKRYNVELPQYKPTKKQKEKQSRREQVLLVLRKSANYYAKLLKTTAGKKAMSYLTERDFTKESIEKFLLGYSPPGWEELMSMLKREGFDEDILLAAGLVIKKDKGGLYDRFRDRLMFPIHNVQGKIVAFGARRLSGDDSGDKQPKYINSPQTIVYDKSKILYGLYQARDEIRRKEYAILTEGYADVISLHQAGFGNAVASSGTSLTIDQLRELKKYCRKLYIVYDADEAGQNAAVRAIDLAVTLGFEIYVVVLPKGEDPDSFVKSRGESLFREYLNDAQMFVDFKINLLKTRNQLDTPAEIAQAIRDVINTIVRIPDRLQHDEYINHLAALLKLSSRQVERIYAEKGKIEKHYQKQQGNEERRIERNAAQVAKDRNLSESENGKFKPDYNQLLPEERLIFKYMISNGEVAEYLLRTFGLAPEHLFTSEAKRLLDLLVDLYARNSDIVKYIAANEEINPYDRDFIIEMAINDELISSEWKLYAKGMKEFDFFKPVKDALKKLELLKLEKEIENLQEKLKSNDLDNIGEVLEAFKKASDRKSELLKIMSNAN